MEKILTVVDKIAPFNDLRIKNEGKKRLKQFKSAKLYIDKKAKYHAVKLIKQKKSQFCKETIKRKY